MHKILLWAQIIGGRGLRAKYKHLIQMHYVQSLVWAPCRCFTNEKKKQPVYIHIQETHTKVYIDIR